MTPAAPAFDAEYWSRRLFSSFRGSGARVLLTAIMRAACSRVSIARGPRAY